MLRFPGTNHPAVVSSIRSRTGAAPDRDCPEGDYSSPKELQNELLLRRHLTIFSLQGLCMFCITYSIAHGHLKWNISRPSLVTDVRCSLHKLIIEIADYAI